jgi:hypothetical protein
MLTTAALLNHTILHYSYTTTTLQIGTTGGLVGVAGLLEGIGRPLPVTSTRPAPDATRRALAPLTDRLSPKKQKPAVTATAITATASKPSSTAATSTTTSSKSGASTAGASPVGKAAAGAAASAGKVSMVVSLENCSYLHLTSLHSTVR